MQPTPSCMHGPMHAPPHTHNYLHTGQLDLVLGNQAAQPANVVILLSARGAQVGDALVQGFEGLSGKRLGAGWLRHLSLAMLRTASRQPKIRNRPNLNFTSHPTMDGHI